MDAYGAGVAKIGFSRYDIVAQQRVFLSEKVGAELLGEFGGELVIGGIGPAALF